MRDLPLHAYRPRQMVRRELVPLDQIDPTLVPQIATDFDLAPSNIKLAAFEQVRVASPGCDMSAVEDQDAIGIADR